MKIASTFQNMLLHSRVSVGFPRHLAGVRVSHGSAQSWTPILKTSDLFSDQGAKLANATTSRNPNIKDALCPIVGETGYPIAPRTPEPCHPTPTTSS